jgi:hypothetical protein
MPVYLKLIDFTPLTYPPLLRYTCTNMKSQSFAPAFYFFYFYYGSLTQTAGGGA